MDYHLNRIPQVYPAEGEANPVNMLSSTLPNQFITRVGAAGEAPAEPRRHQLGRSLALPLGPFAGSFQSAARNKPIHSKRRSA